MKKLLAVVLALMSLCLMLGIGLAEETPAGPVSEELVIDEITVQKLWVDDIPVLYQLPEGNPDELKLCIFLSGLGGTKESLVQYLPYISSRGYLGVVFDNYTHGERAPLKADGTQMVRSEISGRAFSNMYRYGWPILGQTVLDVSKVIDYFIDNFGVSPEVVMGGRSMGGDISISAAGIDTRIVRIAPFITTPDWLRPGMHDLGTGEIMDPGMPDSYAQFFYDNFNPIVNLSRYKRGIPMLMVLGELDKHIPPENAERFKENLARIAPDAAAKIQISYTLGKAHAIPDDVNFVFDWLLLGTPVPDPQPVPQQ
ncbi:MAG: alpha/beta hydrolase [Oscillospiraceae bacterium]|jgi:dienelactone hydrolase|nr:alpha/beta hydrolase [Oscillospiraceae bacterium]